MNVWIMPVCYHHSFPRSGLSGQPALVLHPWIFWDMKLNHSTDTILLSSKYFPSRETSHIWRNATHSKVLLQEHGDVNGKLSISKLRYYLFDWQSLHVCNSGRHGYSSIVYKTLSRRKWKDFHQQNTWRKVQNIQSCETQNSGIILAISTQSLSQCFQAWNNST